MKNKNCLLALLGYLLLQFPCMVYAQNFDSLVTKIESIMPFDPSYRQNIGSDSIIIKKNIKEASQKIDINSENPTGLINNALTLAIKHHSPMYISSGLEMWGNYFLSRENFEKAAKCYLVCLKIEEQYKNHNRAGIMYSKLGLIYNNMEQTQKAMDNLGKALELSQAVNDTINTAITLARIGRAYFDRNFWEKNTIDEKKKNYETSLVYYQKSLRLLQNNKDSVELARQYLAIAYVYNVLKQYDKAEESLQKSIKIFSANQKSPEIGETLYLLGVTYMNRKQFEQAISYMYQALDTAKKYKSSGTHWVYEKLAEAYYGAQDYKASRDMYVKYINTRDSVLTLGRSAQILDMETKYATEKKEQQITALLKQKKLYAIITFSVLFSLLSLIGVLILNRKNIQNKKLLAEQKVAQLEKEQQLVATQSLLEGETSERTRLARDLHDGLGGMLSAVKLNLFDMKNGVTLEMDDVSRFNRVIEMLDKSMQELRRVAHNMMPESLSRYGLKVSLDDFCHSLPNVHFHYFGNEKRLDPKLEVMIYRTVHELVNNALKHAEAQNINVQIIQEPDRVSLTVQDDGKGFDSAKETKGSGLVNIQNRAASFNGEVHIMSKSNEGTEISVEFKV